MFTLYMTAKRSVEDTDSPGLIRCSMNKNKCCPAKPYSIRDTRLSKLEQSSSSPDPNSYRYTFCNVLFHCQVYRNFMMWTTGT